MAEQNKNKNKNKTSTGKSGRFDIPINPEPNNNNNNNNNPTNINPPKNRFGIDSPNQSNINNPTNRLERHNSFAGIIPPQESKYDTKQPAGNETRNKNSNGKFTIEPQKYPQNNESRSHFDNDDNNPPTMQTMQIKPSTSQPQSDITRPTTVAIKKYLLPIDLSFEWLRFGLLFFLILPFTIYSYFPALQQIIYNWTNKIDYSHGFFVVPLVVVFLYLRLDSYPGTRYRLCWLGLIPIMFCVFMRTIASYYYMDALEETSLFFWTLGIVWFFYGTRAFLWALPSLGFLIFMFQLPFSVDVFMKHHLQLYAAKFAAVLLQILGEPAIAINNIIRVKSEILSVEEACSGIRFLISIFAIASAAVLFMRKPWWQNLIVMLIAAPLAMFVNASRITMTGILLLHHRDFLVQFVSPNRVHILADEIAGYTMIIVVSVMFLLFLIYMDKVFKRVNI